MFAGKTTRLIAAVKVLDKSGKKCLVIKYSKDQRYSKVSQGFSGHGSLIVTLCFQDAVASHDHVTLPAVSCSELSELKKGLGGASVCGWDYIATQYDVVAVDEGQFFKDVSHPLLSILLHIMVCHPRHLNSRNASLTEVSWFS